MSLRSKILYVSAPLCFIFALIACVAVSNIFLGHIKTIEYQILTQHIDKLKILAIDFDANQNLARLSDLSDMKLGLVESSDVILFDSNDPSSVQWGEVISGSVALPGFPVLAFEMERDFLQSTWRQVVLLIISIMICAALAVGMIVVMLEKLLLNRVGKLNKGISAIRASGVPNQRLTITGKDEICMISEHINAMLDALEENSQQLSVTNKELERSNKELEQFAYVASHDLQEPLRKVQTFSERLSKKYAHVLDDDGKLYIERMQDASGRMRVLIQDLLGYSRIKSAGQELLAVDLNEVFCGVVADLEIRLEQSGGRVELGTLPVIQGDPLQMRQVFQNLIGNALKFKKPDVAPVVKVSSHEISKGLFEITVIDNGIGFDNKYAERVFEVFQRLHGRSEYEGTGMGLAIVRKIIERHKGTIGAESESGKGTSFILRLPGIHKNDPKPSQTIIKELV